MDDIDEMDEKLLCAGFKYPEEEEEEEEEEEDDAFIKKEMNRQRDIDKDKEEKKYFFLAVNSIKFARDAMQSQILGKYKVDVQQMLNNYERSGETMSKSRQLEIGLPDMPCTRYDIEEGYRCLKDHNNQKRQVELYSAVQDDGDIEARAQEIFNKYKVNFGGEEKRLVIRCHADAVAAFNAKLDKIDTYIRSSYITINDVIGGGFRPGSIYLYAGLSGHGKSVFLCNHARDFIELGTSVLYVTTEMSQDDILTRVYQSLYSAKNIPDIMASDPKKIGVLDVVKIPPKDWTPLNIDELLERTDDKPDILIIDYADELLSDKISKSTYEEMGDVYAGLRRLAEKYNLPIITATQTNRSAADESGGTKEVFGQAAVADSAKKTHQVDVLMSIILTQKDRDENRIGLFVAKNRHGESGKKLTYRCDFEIMRIDDKPLSITLEESLSKDEEEQEECLKNLKRNMG